MNDSQLLEPLRTVEPGAGPGVDIARAIRDGRRRRRTGTALNVVAAVGLVICAAVVSPALLRGLTTEPAAAAFDPLRQVALVGSAGGFTPLAYQTGRHRQEVTLGEADAPAAGPRGTVAIYAAGRLPGQGGGGWQPAVDRAPDVHGRAAWWRGDAELVWEWSDRAWAVVRLTGGSADLRDRVHRVAQSVDTGHSRPVTVPLTVAPAAVTPPMRLLGVRVPVRPDGELAALVFADGDTAEAATLTVSLRTDGVPGRDLPADTLVAGRPGTVEGDRVTVADPSGRFAIRVEPGHGTAFGGAATATALAAAANPVPDPEDERNWTPDPLAG
ncbi:hypothetical protein ACQPZF_19855 [Actinosynnema sp. CS-041913]|uniref:hypothetical protein n=1 Tax=Actinosynnema sp. CS-041913 TaxID=3239917 RepID=UPI003D8DCF2A